MESWVSPIEGHREGEEGTQILEKIRCHQVQFNTELQSNNGGAWACCIIYVPFSKLSVKEIV